MNRDTFNAFTKALATSTSGRRAVGRIGGILFGSILGGIALAELTPGVALASGGNSDCAHFCNAIFPPGSDRGKCKSDAAHGTGLCYTCGPARSGGSLPICCPANSNGQCTSYSSATCCSSGQNCTSGVCVSTCSGVVLANGTCAQDCSASQRCSCGFCDQSNLAGTYFCTNQQGSGARCTSDTSCPLGEFCDYDAICETAVIC